MALRVILQALGTYCIAPCNVIAAKKDENRHYTQNYSPHTWHTI